MALLDKIKSIPKHLVSFQFLKNFILMVGLTAGLIMLTLYSLKYFTNHGESITLPNYAGMTINEATARAKADGFSIIIDSQAFNEKYKPFAVYRQEPSVGSIVKKGRTIILKTNPRGHKPVALPNIYEKQLRLVKFQLDLIHLKIGKITYEPHIAKDVVLKVIYKGKAIKPGYKIPRNSTIDLVLGKGYDNVNTIPNVVGMTLAEARQVLNESNFLLGSIIEKNVDDAESARVLKQIPAEGTIVEEGQLINLHITNDDINEILSELKTEKDSIQ